MDMAQIALLIVAVNVGVLGLGVVIAGFRSFARRRRIPPGTTDRRTQRSAN
jgi:hypothetical protein